MLRGAYVVRRTQEPAGALVPPHMPQTPVTCDAASVSERPAEQLHRDAVVVDTHNDLLMLVARRPGAKQAAYFRDHWLPQLRAGGVDVQVLPIYIDDEFRPEGALRQTLRMIEAGHAVIEANADAVALCRDGADIDAALAPGRIACVLALEGCEAIGVDVALL